MRQMTGRIGAVAVLCGLLSGCRVAEQAGERAADTWPTYRHDGSRSGVAGVSARPPLSLRWAFTARHAPRRE